MPSEAKKERKPSKRLTEIEVSEVSLVDRPANEEPFMVVKRKEGTEMANENKEPEKPATVQKTEADAPPTEDPAPVVTTVDKVMPSLHGALAAEKTDAVKKIAEEIASGLLPVDELRKRVCSMDHMLWQMTDAVDVVQSLSKSLTDAVDMVEKAGDYANPDHAQSMKQVAAALTQIAELATKASAMITLRAAGAYPGPDAAKQPYGAKKSIAISLNEDGTLEVAGLEDVEKGKRFTPARKEAIKTAVSALLGMVKDMDAGSFDEMLKELGIEVKAAGGAAGKMPPDEEEGKMDKPAPAKKSEEDGTEVQKKLDAVTAELTQTKDKLEQLSKRLEDTEKARGTPNASPQDGTSKPVEKTTSIWDGVL